jgi:hypothetical protein
MAPRMVRVTTTPETSSVSANTPSEMRRCRIDVASISAMLPRRSAASVSRVVPSCFCRPSMRGAIARDVVITSGVGLVPAAIIAP